jgi:amidase
MARDIVETGEDDVDNVRTRRIGAVLTGAVLALAATAGQAGAYTFVPTDNGDRWGVQDAYAPRVDTGSIRDTTSNALRGYGGIRVQVSTNPLRNGELMRGFRLRFDTPDRFESTAAVNLGGVAIWRSLKFDHTTNSGRWVDSFKNVTGAPITVDVQFGGQTGIGNASGSTNGIISDTSSGDAVVTSADAWALTRTGVAPAASTSGPSAIVIGSPSPFGGAFTRTGDFLRSPFVLAPTTTGHESNWVGYQNTFTLAPGATRSVAHFVVIGVSEAANGVGPKAPGAQVAAVKAAATALAAAPPFDDLSKGQICSLVNWNVSALTIAGFNITDCPTAPAPVMPTLAPSNPTTTSSPYDVVGKSVHELQADMTAHVTTSRQIVQAYLDRIAAYDVGPLGLNAYEVVAKDALAQAKAADNLRAHGASGPLLGIPVTIKQLYDTKDMVTTNGSLAFEGFRPLTDATQVKLLREAGAVILGKASMEEYALSGQYSDDAYGQVWNAFEPSKSSIASSGGTAVAIAASLAAVGLGSQTGDSLYGPASAASLWTLRGTDGIASSHGVWPLTWLQDFPGTIARSASDLTDMLNITTGTDPLDPITVAADADAHRPADWRTSLDPNALQGKRIGYYDSAFVDPFGTPGTVAAQKAALQKFVAAGATLVKISGGPTLTSASNLGDRAFTGWKFWIDDHPNSPYSDAGQILGSQLRLPYRRLNGGYTGTGLMTDAQIAAYKANRAQQKLDVATWLNNPPTPVDPTSGNPSPGALDAVAFPGLRSDISLNDGGSSSFGRGDPPTNGAGAPSVAFPAGVNDHGEPTNLQLVGRAFDDPKLIAYAYAFDQVDHGHVETSAVPPLTYKADPTPAGFWRFGESSGTTLKDSSGHANNGTYLGGVTLGAASALGDLDTAASFDGVNDSGRVPDSASLDVGASFSAEGWIKRASTAKSYELFNKGTNGIQVTVMSAGSGNQVWLRRAGVTTIAHSAGGVPADGRYHHVAVTMNGAGTARIYIDGVPDTVQVSAVQAIANTAFPLTFGGAAGAQAAFDEFALYDDVLTDAQVVAHDQAGIAP